jgi:succinyl-CoA synthetase alpha subunit
MAVLVHESTRVICHGFTGIRCTFHFEQAITFSTKMIAGYLLSEVVGKILKVVKG